MQEVEGSSPFIRSSETRWKRRVFCCQDGGGIDEMGSGSALGSVVTDSAAGRETARRKVGKDEKVR
jgi:hypothetical protein